ncbi:MAG TPA: 3-hydroxyacyl-CoA dehydrogenase family protein [Halobacteria archaeon]|nr:3-hydroxyacyl-CoA dehydrogenase family protein [Halobacteria archaeon]
MRVDDIKKIAVLGAGAMGHGIAMVALLAGYNVVLRDIKQEFVDKGVKAMREEFEKFYVAKGKLTEEELDKIMNEQLSTAVDMKDAASDIDLSIEAVPEIMKIKKEVFSDLDKYAPKHAILASNTSMMSITEIAKATNRPDKVVGMHWFNPPTRMQLVEVIKGEKTSEETMQVIYDLAKKLGKVPIRVEKDVTGFIVNRIAAPSNVLFGAILDKGEIEPEAVDALLMSVGQPMGAYLLMDYVGLDISSETLKYCAETLSPDYKPSKVISDLISKKQLGMKTGKGIYDWSNGRPQIDESKAALAAEKFDPMEPVAVQINEAVKLLEQDVVKNPDDIDTAVKLGLNMPMGPFEMLGMFEDLKGTLENLAKKYNKKIFEPTKTIKEGKLEEFLESRRK